MPWRKCIQVILITNIIQETIFNKEKTYLDISDMKYNFKAFSVLPPKNEMVNDLI